MEEQTGQSCQGSRLSRGGTQSSPGLPQQRRFDESWVEVIGDEIVTTGLRPNRSLPQQPTSIHAAHAATAAAAAAEASSQDEYDESESEDDRVLTSSSEGIHGLQAEAEMDSEADSDGRPNAFSHPPSHTQRSNSESAMPPHPHSGFTRPSFSQRSQTRTRNAVPNFMSPAVREENDAALRASLTTLLSSKEEAEAHRAPHAGVGPSTQPMELRLVPESELNAEPTRDQPSRQATPSPPRKRASPTRSVSSDKPRHGAATASAPRASKKKKTAPSDETLISPTLLTWVMSAGVVVLVSVVGFGAGYVIGREVGKQEALAVSVGSVNDTTSCGSEVIRSSGSGLRKLRWGVVGKSIVA
ncbi:hypothetical protein BGZ63DRAFT_411678 [Mariannaea sp. PMI_226]|nr:hypothetical protein BGZ63DRAFT_411678 [Mariannaea sp. PMI_226]